MAEDLMNEITVKREKSTSGITVVGVGGAGGNAVNHMYKLGIEGVTFMVCNTDSQALDNSPVGIKVQLGVEGDGAGNDAAKGRDAAIESLDSVRTQLESIKTKMIFIAAGMGGGTGTGASPVIAKLAREMNLLTVAIVTLPLAVEGPHRYEQACHGIEELRKWVDSLLVINNDNILKLYGRLSLGQAFSKADDVLAMAAKGIAEIITVKSDLVNVDFADVSRVLTNSGRAHMSVASARGENRAEEVAEATLQSPLMEAASIRGAKKILLNIAVSDPDKLIYEEVLRILDRIQQHAAVEDETGKKHYANIIWGTAVKPTLGDALELVIVATGFSAGETEKPIVAEGFDINLPPIEEKKPSVDKSQREPFGAPSMKDHVIPARDKNNRKYSDIQKRKSEPSYKTRNVRFETELSQVRRETIKSDDESQERENRHEQSLF